jgi:hypothetical protein
MRITSSHEGPLHANSPYSHLPYPPSRYIVWNTTIDISYSPHHPSISDTDPRYSALGAASTISPLLPSSGFFSGIKGWSIVRTNHFLSHPHSNTTRSCPDRIQEPFNSSSVPMAPLAMPSSRQCQELYLHPTAFTARVKDSRGMDKPDPAQRKGVAKLEVHEAV